MPTPKRTSPAREVDAVADQIHSAAIHLSRRLRVEDEALGISAPRLSALSILSFAGPMRIGELAHTEQVEPPTMSRLIDGLEHDGFVTRGPDPDDARAVRVRVTNAGARALNEGRARRIAVIAGALRSLSPVDLRTLARGIGILERAIDERDP